MVSTAILIASWVSLFLLSWLMILRVIPRDDLFIWGFAIMFAVLAFFAEGYRLASKKENK